MISWIELVMLVFAGSSAQMFLTNLFQFRRPPATTEPRDDGTSQEQRRTVSRTDEPKDPPTVSVLIPARNEEAGLGTTLQRVLACREMSLEVIVLDDHSTDGTAELVRGVAASDARVRLVSGESLPSGWCGKQFACYQLAGRARADQMLFMDADVHLTPDALSRMLRLYRQLDKPLISGFPRQKTGSFGEALLIPLMHLVLLTYLPFLLMRRTLRPSASAGCGQLFLADRETYWQVGGHRAIAGSLHDGVTLPRAYRQQGFATDVFDASEIAECRMYRDWGTTWQGLMKNAHEGIANARLIVPFTVLLLGGYVAPTVWFVLQYLAFGGVSALTGIAFGLSFLPRILMAWRFDRRWSVVPLFPLAVILFLALQWVAFARHASGKQTAWRGREYPLQSAL
jgi:hypothetical protein